VGALEQRRERLRLQIASLAVFAVLVEQQSRLIPDLPEVMAKVRLDIEGRDLRRDPCGDLQRQAGEEEREERRADAEPCGRDGDRLARCTGDERGHVTTPEGAQRPA